MSFQVPEYSRKQVQRAGDILRENPVDPAALASAMPIISNWRAAHAYPLNTFQSTLRKKLRAIGIDNPTVGQRLKRLPSIATKLHRFPNMNLDRMQDIAGLRAVVSSPGKLRIVRNDYEHYSNFTHELRYIHDYVATPKDDGYRSIHLIYRYLNPRAPMYDGLHVELQLRTHLQHAWATAVETVDTFANQAIKAGRPQQDWAEFFKLASAAFSILEQSPLPSEFVGQSFDSIRSRLIAAEAKLNVLVRLRGFSVAADNIHRHGRSSAAYHLVVLDTARHVLNIKPFSADELEAATEAYAKAEVRTASGEPIDAVLVAGGSVEQLRKTYPNYFLDAKVFLDRLRLICRKAIGGSPRRPQTSLRR